jgi:selenocysteine lyase/cysteine desulfurase
MGFLWGRRKLLERLPTFREDFIPDEPPGKIEAGTFIYENVAGMDAAVSYLENLGKSLGDGELDIQASLKRTHLVRAMTAIRSYEESLSLELLRILRECGATIYGVREDHRVHERVPTLCFNLKKTSPAKVTETMADAGIGIRDGHMYTPRLMKRFGLRQDSGVVRISAVHYNTMEEVHRFADVLLDLSKHE